ncbi:MAG: hypothetical protein HY445_01055, partial [Candidatus Niyogibacteria bacterium]|nr:hypothetical protein [Candidatus Niyogibacteria bacterium]
MRFSLYSKGIGMMLGLIVGAGIFAMPAAVARAGVWWGILHFGVAFALMLVLQMWFAEIAFFSRKPERFTGFARELLGKHAERLAFIMIIVGYYGALLAYGVLGGIFLNALMPVVSAFWWGVIFFVIGNILAAFDFRKIGVINFYLTIPLLLFVVFLSSILFSHIDMSVFRGLGSSAFWFLPYGVFVFAFGGIAAIPETSDIIKPLGLGALRRVIVWSMAISAVLYAIFIFSIVGVTGSATTDDALVGIGNAVGAFVIALGAAIGFLAVFTSFLALGSDMQNIFRLDYGRKKMISWLLTGVPPFLLFLFGISQFLEIISFVGAVAFGMSGVLIFFMARSLHRLYPDHQHTFISIKNPL